MMTPTVTAALWSDTLKKEKKRLENPTAEKLAMSWLPGKMTMGAERKGALRILEFSLQP